MTDLAILIDMKKSRIRIHKKTLHAIGDPLFVALIINPEEYTICIQSSSIDDKTAHRMYPNYVKSKICCELYSKSLIYALRDLCPDWDADGRYTLLGDAIPAERMVKFPMREAIRLGDQGNEQHK